MAGASLLLRRPAKPAPWSVPPPPHKQSQAQLKGQLLQEAGVTGSLTASQHALAGRLAALQFGAQRHVQAVNGAGGGSGGPQELRPEPGSGGRWPSAAPGARGRWEVGGNGDCGGGEEGAAYADDAGEPCWPTCYSDICMLGDVAASTAD